MRLSLALLLAFCWSGASPLDVTPQFREAKTVKRGGKLTVLIFYST